MSRTKLSLNQVLNDAKQLAAQNSKTASENIPVEDPVNVDAILENLLESQSKIASQSEEKTFETLVQEKAAELFRIERSSLVKEAQILGASIMDGYVARGQELENQAQKIASTQDGQNSYNQGYELAMKLAQEDEYNQGYELAMKLAQEEIHRGEDEGIKQACFNYGLQQTLEIFAELGE